MKTPEKKGSLNANVLLSIISTLPNEEKLKLISQMLGDLSSEKIEARDLVLSKEILIPIGIFDNNVLGSLEAIVKFLHENSELKFSKIAAMLNRDQKTIWSTYSNASKKLSKFFNNPSNKIFVPASAFANRKFSTLESLVGYLKDLGFSNHEIASMLRLDDRTIWTVYDKVKKKRGKK